MTTNRMLYLFIVCCFFACGDNLFDFTRSESKDVDQALLYLENGEPKKAVTLLLTMIPEAAAKVLKEEKSTGEEFNKKLNTALNTMSREEKEEILPVLAHSISESEGVEVFNVIKEAIDIESGNSTQLKLNYDCEKEAKKLGQYLDLIPDNTQVALEAILKSTAIFNVVNSVVDAEGEFVEFRDVDISSKLSEFIYDVLGYNSVIKLRVDVNNQLTEANKEDITEKDAELIYNLMSESVRILDNIRARDENYEKFYKGMKKNLDKIDSKTPPRVNKVREWLVELTSKICK
jgi:hypothetical protein